MSSFKTTKIMSIVKVKFGTTQSPPKYSCDRVAVAAQRQCHVLQSLPSKRHVQPKHIFAQEGAPILKKLNCFHCKVFLDF